MSFLHVLLVDALNIVMLMMFSEHSIIHVDMMMMMMIS